MLTKCRSPESARLCTGKTGALKGPTSASSKSLQVEQTLQGSPGMWHVVCRDISSSSHLALPITIALAPRVGWLMQRFCVTHLYN